MADVLHLEQVKPYVERWMNYSFNAWVSGSYINSVPGVYTDIPIHTMLTRLVFVLLLAAYGECATSYIDI